MERGVYIGIGPLCCKCYSLLTYLITTLSFISLIHYDIVLYFNSYNEMAHHSEMTTAK